MLQALPVALLPQPAHPVLAFQEADVYEIHHARSTELYTLETCTVAMIGWGTS